MASLPASIDATPLLDLLAQPEVQRQVHRVTLDDYHRFTELDLIDEKTELLRGIVINKVSKSPLHAWLAMKIAERLRLGVGSDWTVRTELPVTCRESDSEPEPDVCVVRGGVDDYLARHPATASLAVEIALSTEAIDRRKASVYAESGIDEYWLFLPKRRIVEVHRQPASGGYTKVTSHGPGETIEPIAFPGIGFSLTEYFPEDA